VLAFFEVAAVDGADDIGVDAFEVEGIEDEQGAQQHLVVHPVPVEKLGGAVEVNVDVLRALVGHAREVLVGSSRGIVEVLRYPLFPEDQPTIGQLAPEQPLVLADADEQKADDVDVGGLARELSSELGLRQADEGARGNSLRPDLVGLRRTQRRAVLLLELLDRRIVGAMAGEHFVELVEDVPRELFEQVAKGYNQTLRRLPHIGGLLTQRAQPFDELGKRLLLDLVLTSERENFRERCRHAEGVTVYSTPRTNP